MLGRCEEVRNERPCLAGAASVGGVRMGLTSLSSGRFAGGTVLESHRSTYRLLAPPERGAGSTAPAIGLGLIQRALLAIIGALLLSACGDRFPDYRYKMTIYVDTPEGEKAFSSVRQVRVEEASSIADSSGAREKVRLEGEAVILDLPGRTIYALLSKPNSPQYAAYIPAAALARHIPVEGALSAREQELQELKEVRPNSGAHLDEASERLQKMVEVKGPKELPRTRPNRDPYRGPRQIEQWPMFVAFSDSSDPKSVYEVSPEEIGVKRVTIEITDDDVTRFIAEKLPLNASCADCMLDGQRFEDLTSKKLASHLTFYDFSTEYSK